MTNNFAIFLFVVVWLAAGPLLYMLARKRSASALGMVLGFWALSFVSYVPGSFLYLLDWYDDYYPRIVVAGGAVSCTIAMVFFVLGAATATFRNSVAKLSAVDSGYRFSVVQLRWLVLISLALGVAARIANQLGLSEIPSIGALLSAFTNLFLVALIILFLPNIREKLRIGAIGFITIFLYPAFILIREGFLGYGLAMLLIISAVGLANVGLRMRYILAAPFILYFGLSIFTTYMRDRTQIREIVWQNSTNSERLETVAESFTKFEWFDWDDQAHLVQIDRRLNQTFLVGLSREFLTNNPDRLLNGASYSAAMLSMIPRAIWPDKPVVAGGNQLVTDVTGVTFSQGTSVGAGPIMELYANNLFTALIVGMFLFGFLMQELDIKASRAAKREDFLQLISACLPCLMILQPIGSMTEIMSGLASGVLIAFLFRLVLTFILSERRASRVAISTPANAKTL
jgi:hypothetical protein